MPLKIARGRRGAIVNISSSSTQRAMTRMIGDGVTKAGIAYTTRWLTVELSREFSHRVRVNAVVPGFFVEQQNRVLLNENGSLTPRGQRIVDHIPAGRFGVLDELVGTVIWLCSPSSSFVNGVVVPVDGGFNAWSGL